MLTVLNGELPPPFILYNVCFYTLEEEKVLGIVLIKQGMSLEFHLVS